MILSYWHLHQQHFRSWLTKCSEFAETHSLIYNETKTKYMCIKPPAVKAVYVPNVCLNGVNIRHVAKENYLGYCISDDCYDDDHIQKEIRGIYARGNMLIRNFKQCTDDVKAKLYKTYCSSVYCCALISRYHKRFL